MSPCTCRPELARLSKALCSTGELHKYRVPGAHNRHIRWRSPCYPVRRCRPEPSSDIWKRVPLLRPCHPYSGVLAPTAITWSETVYHCSSHPGAMLANPSRHHGHLFQISGRGEIQGDLALGPRVVRIRLRIRQYQQSRYPPGRFWCFAPEQQVSRRLGKSL